MVSNHYYGINAENNSSESTVAALPEKLCGKVGKMPFQHYGRNQGCQMVYFQTKNPNLGKFWRVLQWKMLVYFFTIWSILRPIGIFYGHLVYFVVIWYTLPHFGILCQEKSGRSGRNVPT
jgi:hypothetical protein